jgi:hypothetical protein
MTHSISATVDPLPGVNLVELVTFATTVKNSCQEYVEELNHREYHAHETEIHNFLIWLDALELVHDGSY